MFLGTLGKCICSNYTIELKEAKHYHIKCFPVLKIHILTLEKEDDRLINIGV